LFESVRTSKRTVNASEVAWSEVGARRASRNGTVGARERINLKWSLLQFGGEENKKIRWWAQGAGEWEFTVALAKVYSCPSRARGS
jgi:hypothetical protein